MPTRNGVYYDLPSSPHVFHWNGLFFHFSTVRHKERFIEGVLQRERQMTATMSKRIGCKVDMALPASVQFYRQVETRGFYIESEDGRSASCPEHLRLDGLRVRWRD